VKTKEHIGILGDGHHDKMSYFSD